jgi:hypothetical protein
LYREYWRDAGQVVLPDDDPDRDQAFVDCAVDPACAQKAVENYMAKYGRVSSRAGTTWAGGRQELCVNAVTENNNNNNDIVANAAGGAEGRTGFLPPSCAPVAR